MKWASPEYRLLSFPAFGLCSSYRVEDTKGLRAQFWYLIPEENQEPGFPCRVCGLGGSASRSLSLCYYTRLFPRMNGVESAEPRSWCRDKCSMGSNLDSFFFFFFNVDHFSSLYSICYNIVLFHILIVWPWGMWNLSSLTLSSRGVDWTHTPALEGKVLTTGPPGKSQLNHYSWQRQNGLHPTSA